MSMAKNETEDIDSLLQGNRFKIPDYQRRYCWRSIQIEALWQDIEESLGNNNMPHFIGTLSFQKVERSDSDIETIYEIIDGQQRITTLFILLKVLIDKLRDKHFRDKLLSALIGNEKDLKLQLPGEDDAFLKKLLFSPNTIKERTKMTKRSQICLSCARAKFNSFTEDFTEKKIKDRITFIRDKIEVLVFNVENQAQAVKMFSIINDRGLPLGILDKTKSTLMLYSTLYLENKLNPLINESFKGIFNSYDNLLVLKDKLGILGRFEENTIFTHHYYSSRKLFADTWVSKNSADIIFNNLKRKCEELKVKPPKLKKFIEAYVNDLKNFSINYYTLVESIEENPILLKPFIYLEFSATLYPLLVRAYMQGKLNDLLPILEAVEVRVYKLRGTDPKADMYLLSSYLSEEDLGIDDIRKRLINFGERFASKYVFRTYLEGEVYGNNAVKYILAEYSRDNHSISLYKDFQIEHIFSAAPEYETSDYGFSDDYSIEKNRLGNLALLEQNLNASVGNSPPINKVNTYLRSKNSETRRLAGEINRGKFAKSNVDQRREAIIEFCITRFPYE